MPAKPARRNCCGERSPSALRCTARSCSECCVSSCTCLASSCSVWSFSMCTGLEAKQELSCSWRGRSKLWPSKCPRGPHRCSRCRQEGASFDKPLLTILLATPSVPERLESTVLEQRRPNITATLVSSQPIASVEYRLPFEHPADANSSVFGRPPSLGE